MRLGFFNYLLCFVPFGILTSQTILAQTSSSNTLKKESTTYLICYYRDKVTGQNTWQWGKDEQNRDVKIEGQWTGFTGDALFKVDDMTKEDFEAKYTPYCIHTNTNPDIEYAEYGVADDRVSFKHEIWFEKTALTSNKYPKRFVVFGDSLSDNGNLFNYSHETIVTGSYYLGRFSNGPVWAEFMAKELNMDLYDWAIAGVTSDTPFPVPYSMDEEVDNYLFDMKNVANPDYANSLYVVFVGANNYIFHEAAVPSGIVKNVKDSLEKLIAAGGRHFIVPNLPDISYTPLLISEGVTAQENMKNKIILHNQLLDQAVAEIKEKYSALNLHILRPDVYTFLNDVIINPKKFGVTNVTEKCDKALPVGSYDEKTYCDEPKTYLFWDFVHPTTKIHCEMAQDIMLQLTNEYGISPYKKDYSKCDLSFVNKLSNRG